MPAFNARMIAVLRRSLEADSRSAETWMRLGHAQRMLGDFEAAGQAYAEALARQPDNRSAAWLLAITTGRPPPPAPPGETSVPFLHLRNFLTPAESARLRRWAEKSRSLFRPARLMTSDGLQAVPQQHRSFNLSGEAQERETAWLMSKVRAMLPRAEAALGMDGPSARTGWIALCAQANEGFSWPHRDPGDLLVVVCYLHQEPRPFSGGDLLLHDSTPATKADELRTFSRIQPIGNSAICYPGGAFHEITPVACDSDDVLAARLTARVSMVVRRH